MRRAGHRRIACVPGFGDLIGAALLARCGARGGRGVSGRVENRLRDAGLRPDAGRSAEIEWRRAAKGRAGRLIQRRHRRIEVARAEARRGAPRRRRRRRGAGGAAARDLARQRRLEADRGMDHGAKRDQRDPRPAGVVIVGRRAAPPARAKIFFVLVVELIAKANAGGERQNRSHGKNAGNGEHGRRKVGKKPARDRQNCIADDAAKPRRQSPARRRRQGTTQAPPPVRRR